MLRRICFHLALALLLLASSTVVAQTGTGEVTGTVLDASQAAVSGATVTLTNVRTNIQSKATTTQSGAYVFVNLVPGLYNVRVEAQGFKSASVTPFDVGVSQIVTRNVTLTVGALSETIEVQSTAPLLQTSSSELGSVIGTKAVNDLPLNGRNFTELLLLTPGVTPINSSQGGNAGGTPDGGIVSLSTSTVAKPSFHGSQNRSVIYYQDGIINTDFRGNVPGVQPNIDLIQEFEVVSHDTRADVGGVIGGVVNMVSKSGTNQFHGSGFEFIRNDFFDARDHFKDVDSNGLPKEVAQFHQNQFGATFGGPIIRNRTFFYAGYSGWRFSKPAQSFSRVPTPDELNGDFSLNPFGDVNPLYNPYSTHETFAGSGVYTRDPFACDATGNPVVPNPDGTQTGGTPCLKIPSQLISPVMQDLLKTYLDAPNLAGDPTHNYIENLAGTDSENDFSVRVDHRLTDRDSLFFRYSEMWDTAISHNTPQILSSSKYHYHNEGGGWVHTFTPSLILDVRGGYLSGPVDAFDTRKAGIAPEQKYFNDLDQYGSLIIGLASPYSGTPGGSVIPNRDNFRNNPGWNATANISWIHGSHNFKFGYDYNLTSRIQKNKFEEFDFDATTTSDPLTAKTGNPLASALLGYPTRFVGQLFDHSEVNIDVPEWALYAQDSWKLTPHLTVNWGLRWDVNPLSTINGPRVSDAVDIFNQKYYVGLDAFPALCANSPTSNPCMPQDLSLINNNNAIVLGGHKLQVPKSVYNQLGPRVGVAWQMTPTMVLRGGYGLFYDALIARTQTAQNDLEQLAWPYTTGFLGSANVADSTTGVQAGGPGNPLVPITSIEGAFPSPVPPLTPWTPHGWADDPNIQNPRSHEWNLEIQKQFGQNMMLSTAYVGSASRHLAYTGPNANAARQPSPAGTPVATIDSMRAMPFLEGNVLYYTQDIGRGNYNALEVKAQRRFAQGLNSQLSFTWGKSLDNSSGYYDVENGSGGPGVQNYFDPQSNYSVSGYDVSKYLSWYTVWDLPVGHGKRWLSSGPGAWILGDWQLNYIMQARSGQPYTLGLPKGDYANIFGSNTAGVASYERPDEIGDPFANVPAGYLFNPTAFAVPPCSLASPNCHFGNMRRNTFRSPSVFGMDISLFKNIPFGKSETRMAQLRFESFNAFNNVNWATPATTINGCTDISTPAGLKSCNGAGKVSSLALAPRVFQFAVKIYF